MTQLNGLTLAYLGDSIYEVYIREALLGRGITKVEKLHNEAIKYTSAKGQKEALDKIQPIEDFNDGMPFSEEIKIEMFSNKNIKAIEIPSALYAREGDVKLESFSDGWKNLKYLFLKRVK